jgi:multiple sugar transport system ATP-binding protein
MRTEFKALEATLRYTTIYVTHDYLEALSLGDRLIVLNLGVIQQVGPPQQVFDYPVNIFVAKILGHPQINLVECTVRRDGEDAQLISKDAAVCVNVPSRLRHTILNGDAQSYMLGIRPLNISVVSNSTGNGSGATRPANQCDGAVYVYERLGTKGILTVTVGEQKFDIITPIEVEYQIDERVRLAIDADQIMIFDVQTQQNISFMEQR